MPALVTETCNANTSVPCKERWQHPPPYIHTPAAAAAAATVDQGEVEGEVDAFVGGAYEMCMCRGAFFTRGMYHVTR